MFDLEQGTMSLLSFQQAIGGSLSRSARVTQDMDEDDEALECSSGSVIITVPALNEIVVPAQLFPPAATSQPTSQPTLQPTSLLCYKIACEGYDLFKATNKPPWHTETSMIEWRMKMLNPKEWEMKLQ